MREVSYCEPISHISLNEVASYEYVYSCKKEYTQPHAIYYYQWALLTTVSLLSFLVLLCIEDHFHI